MPWIESHGQLVWQTDEGEVSGGTFSFAPTWSSDDIQSDEPPADAPTLNEIVDKHIKKLEEKDDARPQKTKFVCVACSKTIRANAKKFPYGHPFVKELGIKRAVCNDCIKNFHQCQGCEQFFKFDELQYDHCPRCVESAPRHLIRNYSLKVEHEMEMRQSVPSRDTKKDEKWNWTGAPKDEIFYGVELELASENLGLDVLRVNSAIKDFARLKKDSSIKPRGFEIVSVPATIEEHRHIWNPFFDKLPQTCHPFRSCGMHVHASRSRMSELQIAKMLVFLHDEQNRPFVELIAGRKSNKQNDFTSPKTFLDIRKVNDPKYDRHTALNLKNDQTIEFRIFASTCDKRIFLKNLEFVRAIIKWSDWATNSLREASNWKKFVDWVWNQRKEYEYLCMFFETASFQKLLNENR